MTLGGNFLIFVYYFFCEDVLLGSIPLKYINKIDELLQICIVSHAL